MFYDGAYRQPPGGADAAKVSLSGLSHFLLQDSQLCRTDKPKRFIERRESNYTTWSPRLGHYNMSNTFPPPTILQGMLASTSSTRQYTRCTVL